MDLFDILSMMMLHGKDMEREVVEFEKNGIKTQIEVYFAPNGLPVGTKTRVMINGDLQSPTPEQDELEQLNEALLQAIEEEDYPRCAELKRRKDELLKQK